MKLGKYIDDYGIMVYLMMMKHELFFEKWLKRTGLFKDKTKGDCHLIK